MRILCLYYQLTRTNDDAELQHFGKQVDVLTAPAKHKDDLKKLPEQFEKGQTKINKSQKNKICEEKETIYCPLLSEKDASSS